MCELKRLEDKLVELLKPSLFTGDGPKLLSDCNMQSSRPYRTLIIDDQVCGASLPSPLSSGSAMHPAPLHVGMRTGCNGVAAGVVQFCCNAALTARPLTEVPFIDC